MGHPVYPAKKTGPGYSGLPPSAALCAGSVPPCDGKCYGSIFHNPLLTNVCYDVTPQNTCSAPAIPLITACQIMSVKMSLKNVLLTALTACHNVAPLCVKFVHYREDLSKE
jgi:hypothetical protein